MALLSLFCWQVSKLGLRDPAPGPACRVGQPPLGSHRWLSTERPLRGLTPFGPTCPGLPELIAIISSHPLAFLGQPAARPRGQGGTLLHHKCCCRPWTWGLVRPAVVACVASAAALNPLP